VILDRMIFHHRYQQEAGDTAGDEGVGESSSGDIGDTGDGTSDTGGGDDSGGAGIFGDGAGGGVNLDDPTALLSSEDILTAGRALAVKGVPLQIGSLFDALNKLRARARGSTAEIFSDITPQLSALRGQYAGASSAIARRLGYAGGGQVKRAQQGELSKAARQYGSLITQGQQGGFTNLLNTLGGFQPALSGAARAPSVTTRNLPTDLRNVGTSLASFGSAARTLNNSFNTSTAAQAAATIQGFRNNPQFNPDAFAPIT